MKQYIPVIGIVAVIAGALAGCSQKQPPVGTERGPCYGNGTCNEGLMCMSDLCVSPPPADCRKVATKLNYLVLGNYAQQSERDAYISRMTATCKQAELTLKEADCILAAKNRSALTQCPKPLILGSCERALAHARQILSGANPQLADMLDQGPALRRCRQRGITKDKEDCVLRATDKQQLDACGRLY